MVPMASTAQIAGLARSALLSLLSRADSRAMLACIASRFRFHCSDSGEGPAAPQLHSYSLRKPGAPELRISEWLRPGGATTLLSMKVSSCFMLRLLPTPVARTLKHMDTSAAAPCQDVVHGTCKYIQDTGKPCHKALQTRVVIWFMQPSS